MVTNSKGFFRSAIFPPPSCCHFAVATSLFSLAVPSTALIGSLPRVRLMPPPASARSPSSFAELVRLRLPSTPPCWYTCRDFFSHCPAVCSPLCLSSVALRSARPQRARLLPCADMLPALSPLSIAMPFRLYPQPAAVLCRPAPRSQPLPFRSQSGRCRCCHRVIARQARVSFHKTPRGRRGLPGSFIVYTRAAMGTPALSAARVACGCSLQLGAGLLWVGGVTPLPSLWASQWRQQ